MQSEWRETTLGGLGEVARGRSRHRPRYAEHLYGGSYPFIQTGDVKASNGRINKHSQTYSEAGLAQSRLWPENTMCITIAANIAETGILAYPACFPDSIIGFIADEKKCDVYFVEYMFRYLRRRIQHEASGSVQDNINLQTIDRLKFSLPPIKEQKAIAHILGSLDDKIELNRQMNATLEAMAQALFKSWFVDFDPVLDNALAAGNPIPDELQEKAAAREALGNARKPLPEDIAALFPAAFVWTEEMGWIPEGWDVGKLEDHCSITMGQSPKGDSYNTVGEGTPLINGPVEFGEYFTEKTKWTTEPIRFSENGDLIVCVRGSTTGRFVKSDGRYCLGRGVCAIRGKVSQAFSDCLFKECLPTFLRFTTGSTFPSWNAPTIKSFAVIKPHEKLIKSFDSLAAPMIEQQGHLNKINTGASQLRDTLLPKLLSGELRIPDAEKLVEEIQS